MARPSTSLSLGKTKPKKSKLASSINDLEEKLKTAVSENSSLNPLVELLGLACNAEDPRDTNKAIHALHRIFVVILASGKMSNTVTEDSKIVRAWIWERLVRFLEFLTSLLADEEKVLRISTMQILFSLLKHLSAAAESSGNSKHPQFHVTTFQKIVSGLLLCPPSKRPLSSPSSKAAEDHGKIDPDVRDLFVDNWFGPYDDIRWFFLRETDRLLTTYSENNHNHLVANLLSILERLTTFPTRASELRTWWVEGLGRVPPEPKKGTSGDAEDVWRSADKKNDEEADEGDDWRKFFDDDSPSAGSSAERKAPAARLHKLTVHQSLHSLTSHKTAFTRTWLSLLSQLSSVDDPSKALSIRALLVMHRGVMPHLTRPILLMDWISGCVDYGGVAGLLGLNALFVLMREYNLDYPSFYTRLYRFLDRDALHVKYRARFFRMLELFLSSTHLPASLLASFVKRLSRLSLGASPSAIIMVIPFTYNILKRHPALMVMIHRADDDDEATDTDCFNPDEPNPNLTGALQSSLWELYSHRNHYHTTVSTMARIFEEAFTKPAYPLEDFLDHTYDTLLDTEFRRTIKREPATATELKKNMFPSANTTEGEDITSDFVANLWSF